MGKVKIKVSNFLIILHKHGVHNISPLPNAEFIYLFIYFAELASCFLISKSKDSEEASSPAIAIASVVVTHHKTNANKFSSPFHLPPPALYYLIVFNIISQ